jgi:guanylate kinase
MINVSCSSGRPSEDYSEFLTHLYSLIGATLVRPGRWVLRTQLSKDELGSLWIAIGNDLVQAGLLPGLQYFPAINTDFGLQIGTHEILDLVAIGAQWELIEQAKSEVRPCPAIVLAGLPGSGKSTVADYLRQMAAVPKGQTITTRGKRCDDIDFERGHLTRTDDTTLQSLYLSPAYALPVVFRNEKYVPKAASMIERFNPKYSLVVLTDSHYFRVIWRKRLMPDIKVIWLDANNSTRRERLRTRLSENDRVTKQYLKSCYQTKSIADLIIPTETTPPKQVAVNIINWVYGPKENLYEL